MVERTAEEIDRVKKATQQLSEETKRASALGQQLGRVMVSAFKDIAVKGKGLREVLNSLAQSLSKMVLNAAFKPLEKALGGIFTNALSGGPLKFAKGGVFQQAMPIPFAKGGVISAPVSFPLGRGQTGLAGEAGAEAILPLTRGGDGRLGVRSQGGGGLNVTFNVQTPDAASFQRSESQIAAMLARAVGQGQRNL